MKGAGQQTTVVYAGAHLEFLVFVESSEAYENYVKNQDNTIPLSQVVDGFQVFKIDHGTTGIQEQPSNAELENEFGTKDVDTVIQKILKEGKLQHKTNPHRGGNTNLSNGTR